MTNNIQYRRSRPIKAQQGTPLMVKIDDGSRARQENARQKAISNYYFEQAPSIQNLARGAYHWAMSEPMLFGEDEQPYISKGYAPVSTTAVGAVRQIPNYVRQLPLTLASISSWLGRFGSATPSSRVLRAEEAPAQGEQSSEQASEREGTSTSSTATPPNPEDGKKKKLSDYLRFERNSNSTPTNYPNFWRNVRNLGRLYMYTAAAAPVIDVAGNAIAASRESKDQIHQFHWPFSKLVFAPFTGAYKLMGDAYYNPIDSTKVEQPQAIMQSQQPSNSPQTVAPTVVTAPRDTIDPAVQDSLIKVFLSR